MIITIPEIYTSLQDIVFKLGPVGLQITSQRLPESILANFKLLFQVYVTDGEKADKGYPNLSLSLDKLFMCYFLSLLARYSR